MSFKRFACWQGDDALKLLKVEALDGDEALFQATHTPISKFEVEGRHANKVSEQTDEKLLEVLTDKSLSHAFCVVEGEPGSGKSHLIRWLKILWPKTDLDMVMLIPRAKGSLDGTLRALKEQLSPEYAHLFHGLGDVQTISLFGRARTFQTNLANTLKKKHFPDNPPIHADFCDKWDLSNIFLNSTVLDSWSAPTRILECVSGNDGNRDSKMGEFLISDIAELAKMGTQRLKGIGPRAYQFFRKLVKEMRFFKTLENPDLEQLKQYADNKLNNALTLLEALNASARINSALRGTLGISQHALKKLFHELRISLKKKGGRLVLLLEDITNFQGIDDQLIDALIAKSLHDEQLCDLISVVGITTAYFDKHLKNLGNIRDRMTLHISIGEDREQGFQKTAALEDLVTREQFVGRYLRAVRVGVHGLREWAKDKTDLPPIPNPCDRCPHRQACQTAFGTVSLAGQKVSFYPFSATSIHKMYEALEDKEGGQTHHTPRGLLQSVLAPSLKHPEVVEDGEYPSPHLEISTFPEDSQRIYGQMKEVLSNHVPDDKERERMRRLIVWWGNSNEDVQTSSRADGSLAFAGIPQAIFEQFELPWLGDKRESVAEVRPQEAIPPVPTPEPLPEKEGRTSHLTQLNSPNERNAVASPRQKSQRVKPKKPSQKKMNTYRSLIQKWAEGEDIPNAEDFLPIIQDLLKDLPWGRIDVNPWQRNKLLTKDTVVLAGTKKTGIRHLVIPREEWVRRGIDSYLCLEMKEDEGNKDFHLRNLACFWKKLSQLVQSRVDEWSLSTQVDEKWQAVITAAQILLARCWLRGDISPMAPEWLQWHALLEPNPADPSTHPAYRVPMWNDLLDSTKTKPSDIREMLLQSLAMRQGDGDKFLLDASLMLGAIKNLKQRFRLDPFPTKDHTELEQKRALMGKMVSIAHEIDGRLHKIPLGELRRQVKRIQKLEASCDGASFSHYLSRIERVSEKDSLFLSILQGDSSYQQFKECLLVLKRHGFLPEKDEGPAEILDDFLAEVEKENDLENLPSDQLMDWVLKSPVSLLLPAYETCSKLDACMNRIAEKTQKAIDATGNTDGGLADIQNFGSKIKNDVAQFRHFLGGTGG